LYHSCSNNSNKREKYGNKFSINHHRQRINISWGYLQCNPKSCKSKTHGRPCGRGSESCSSIPNFRIFAKRQAFIWSSGVFPEWHLVLFRCSFGVPPYSTSPIVRPEIIRSGLKKCFLSLATTLIKKLK